MAKIAVVATLIFSRLDMMFTLSSNCTTLQWRLILKWRFSGGLAANQSIGSNVDSNR
jgi:hypothetical protein